MIRIKPPTQEAFLLSTGPERPLNLMLDNKARYPGQLLILIFRAAERTLRSVLRP